MKPQARHFLLPQLERNQHRNKNEEEKSGEWVLGFGYKSERREKVC